MSFDINWENLTSDDRINNNIRNFLDQQFNSISLPSFIDKLSVSDFSMGTTPPEITIRHIGNPFDEFYSEANSDEEDRKDSNSVSHPSSGADDSSSSDEESTSNSGIKADKSDEKSLFEFLTKDPSTLNSQGASKQLHNYSMNNLGLGTHDRDTPTAFFKSSALKLSSPSTFEQNQQADIANDIQFVLDLNYCGDIMIEISVNLLVNYPSSQFISLPIKLKITDLEIHVLAAIAYIRNDIYISFLCDLNTSKTDYFSLLGNQDNNADSRNRTTGIVFQGGNFVDYATSNNKERIDVIRNVKIDTEIGENEHNVLRNVGKVEKFLVEQLRNIIRDEVCWPSWVCINLDSEEEISDDEMFR